MPTILSQCLVDPWPHSVTVKGNGGYTINHIQSYSRRLGAVDVPAGSSSVI